MSGEHPLDKKLRERKQQADRTASLEQTKQRAMEGRRARTAAEWPKDEESLRAAINASNDVLAKHGKQELFTYHSLPQQEGDVARSYVQLRDAHTASTRFLDIRVLVEGIVVTVLRISSRKNDHSVGNANVASWNERLNELHDQLSL
jgi:hypothetical protein